MKAKTIVLGVLASAVAYGGCDIRNGSDQQQDRLAKVLRGSPGCPNDILKLHPLLPVVPAMVANRGRHNPKLGSFSFFERTAESDVFLGHFTDVENGKIIFDRAPAEGKLLIEAIAWDEPRGLYNFYELRGTGTTGQWFYRGNSEDALKDNEWLHRSEPAKFGSAMRCSACHNAGEPILKEILPPHNDWWTKARKLDLAPNRAADDVAAWMRKLDDTPNFAKAVIAATDKLFASKGYQAARRARSLQEQLRPLFCTVEINLESDLVPADDQAAEVKIPSPSLVDPRLATGPIVMAGNRYEALLKASGLEFPETSRRDADYRWLVPVKSRADMEVLAQEDKEFVADVLAVDLENPLFSSVRCALLSALPDKREQGWETEFQKNLAARTDAGAKELLKNLTDPTRSLAFHQSAAKKRLQVLAVMATTDTGSKQLFDELLAQRQSVFDSVISKNPKGQILEPGFRVIFPK